VHLLHDAVCHYISPGHFRRNKHEVICWYSRIGEACKLQAEKKAAVVVVLVATEQYVLWCWWRLNSTFCGAGGD
jgi:hypothetical protein